VCVCVYACLLGKQGQRLLFCHTLLINLNNNMKLKGDATTHSHNVNGKALPHKMSSRKQLDAISLSLFLTYSCSCSLLSEFVVWVQFARLLLLPQRDDVIEKTETRVPCVINITQFMFSHSWVFTVYSKEGQKGEREKGSALFY